MKTFTWLRVVEDFLLLRNKVIFQFSITLFMKIFITESFRVLVVGKATT